MQCNLAFLRDIYKCNFVEHDLTNCINKVCDDIKLNEEDRGTIYNLKTLISTSSNHITIPGFSEIKNMIDYLTTF